MTHVQVKSSRCSYCFHFKLVEYIGSHHGLQETYRTLIFSSLTQVPELAGFWLLTLILQFPLLLYLLIDSRAMPFPIERAVHIIFLSFLAFDVVGGYFALKRMTHHQVMKFHLQQFDDIELMEDSPGRFMNSPNLATQRYTPLR